jgi:nucleotide-binding universal stress UspA family protein
VHAPTATPIVVQDVPVIDEQLHSFARTHERAYLEHLRHRMLAAPNLSVTCQLLDRTIIGAGATGVAQSLANYAVETGCDLIVMSTHGRGGLARFWLGSVADSLIRQTPLPLLLVRPHEPSHEAADEPVFKHILIPLDGSALAEQIMPHAFRFAQHTHAEITLLQAITPLVMAYGTELYGAGWDNTLPEKLRAYTSDYLEGVAARLRAEMLIVQTAVVDAFPAHAILDYARTHTVALIALATHGRSGVARWLLGSVADKVVCGAETPLLLYRPQ